MDEWIPAHPAIGAADPDNDQIFEEALDCFDARTRYHVQWYQFMDHHFDEEFWETARTRLTSYRHAELESQENLDRFMSKGLSINEAKEAITFEIVKDMELKEKEDPQKTVKEQNRKLDKHIRSHVNEALIAMKRWVVFESSQGRGKSPKIAEEAQIEDSKHVKWLVESEEGGWTKGERLDWIDLRGFEVRELERARTRPERRANDERSYDRRREEKKGATIHGRIICYTLGGLKAVFGRGLKMCIRLEDRWRAKQDVKIWTADLPKNNATVSTMAEKVA